MTRQNKYRLLGVVALVLLPAALAAFNRMKYVWHSIIPGATIRNDPAGYGYYGASRAGGTRKHNGVDLLVTPNQTVYSPIEGKITRVAYPYSGETAWKGLEIQGTGDWSRYRVKMFYMDPFPPLIGRDVIRGEAIGIAQDISKKYPGQGMKPHVHVEIFENGYRIDPTPFLL